MIASCMTSLIHALTSPPPFRLPPIPLEHPSHDLSGLVREVSDSGLVRVARSGGTRQTTSCSDAPLYLHLAVGSLEPVPLTRTSLARSTELSNLAISNAPPTVSSALCPLVQTRLDW